MIRRPSLRVACIADVAPEVLDELESDLDTFAAFLPFPITDYHVVGSAACRRWQFHSDLDVVLVTGDKWAEARALWRSQSDKSREAIRFSRTLWDKYGVRIELSFEAADMKPVVAKSYYSIKERKHYRPHLTQRVDVHPVTGAVTARIAPTPTRPPRFFWSFQDAEGNVHANEDPYPREEVEKWAKRYGAKFLRIGDTEDTAYLKR